MGLNYNCLNCSLIKNINPDCVCDQSQQNSCPDVLQCHQSLIWKGCYKCESMDPGARCETCNNGYNISINGICLECEENTPPIPNCVILEECDKCGMCSKGYYIDDDGSCVKCENHTCCPGNTHNHPSASGCLECSEDQMRCASCPINTTLKSGMKRTCQQQSGSCLH